MLNPPHGRNFIRPLLLSTPPPPLEGYFQGWGVGVLEFGPPIFAPTVYSPPPPPQTSSRPHPRPRACLILQCVTSSGERSSSSCGCVAGLYLGWSGVCEKCPKLRKLSARERERVRDRERERERERPMIFSPCEPLKDTKYGQCNTQREKLKGNN